MLIDLMQLVQVFSASYLMTVTLPFIIVEGTIRGLHCNGILIGVDKCSCRRYLPAVGIGNREERAATIAHIGNGIGDRVKRRRGVGIRSQNCDKIANWVVEDTVCTRDYGGIVSSSWEHGRVVICILNLY